MRWRRGCVRAPADAHRRGPLLAPHFLIHPPLLPSSPPLLSSPVSGFSSPSVSHSVFRSTLLLSPHQNILGNRASAHHDGIPTLFLSRQGADWYKTWGGRRGGGGDGGRSSSVPATAFVGRFSSSLALVALRPSAHRSPAQSLREPSFYCFPAAAIAAGGRGREGTKKSETSDEILCLVWRATRCFARPAPNVRPFR